MENKKKGKGGCLVVAQIIILIIGLFVELPWYILWGPTLLAAGTLLLAFILSFVIAADEGVKSMNRMKE